MNFYFFIILLFITTPTQPAAATEKPTEKTPRFSTNLQAYEYLLCCDKPGQILDKYDNTLLHLAAYHGHLPWIKHFLKIGTNINAQQKLIYGLRSIAPPLIIINYVLNIS
ncbi:ankyrin repeat domain-containing protein [bacterium]|nr:MAG: ankyrin repeat domain-containing protein [bacterium]